MFRPHGLASGAYWPHAVAHAPVLPPPGEPGSCECGQIASPACDNCLCARCCTGCSRHGTAVSDSGSDYSSYSYVPPQHSNYSPRPGEPGSCRCGQVASPQCCFGLCGRCCGGCLRHVAADSRSEQGARPGEPGSCSCGQVASPQCDYAMCGRCCGGCSRHAVAADSQSEERPVPGELGSCSCGQVASPYCDHLVCAMCCNGCSWHTYPTDTESMGPAPQPGEPGSCSCGQTASPSCDNSLCAACCRGCSRHGYAEQQQQQPVAQLQQQPQPQQQHVVRCICGQPAAQSCSLSLCGGCCNDSRCPRHAPAPLPPVPRMGGFRLSAHEVPASMMPEAFWASGGLSQQEVLRQLGQALRSVLSPEAWDDDSDAYEDVPATRAGVGYVPVTEQPAQSVPLRPSAPAAAAREDRGVAGSSGGSTNPAAAPAGAASSSRTAQQPTATAAAAAAGAGSSSRGGEESTSPAAAGGPMGGAEEELFQLKHCVVCLDEPRSVLLLPCKHLVLCGGCMQRMQSTVRQQYQQGASDQEDVLCPVCREPAASMLPGVILA